MRDTGTPIETQPDIEPIPRLPFFKRCLARLTAWMVRLWYATLRVRVSPRLVSYFSDTSRTNVCLLWHNRITMGPLIYFTSKRRRKIYTLISASKDGAFVSTVLQYLGMGVVRGSSSRRATQALRELLRVLESQSDIVITPDGPRGPMYSMSASAAMLVRKSGARIILLMPVPRRALRVKSWDGFYIPLPFTAVDIDADVIDDVARLAEGGDDALRDTLKARYDAITRETRPHPAPELSNKAHR